MRMSWYSRLLVLTWCVGCGGGSGSERNAPELRLISPSADGAANAAQPSLTWAGGDGAAGYRVSLFADERHTQPIEEQSVEAPATTARTEFAAGDVVFARVEALDGAGIATRAADSRFRVLPTPADFPPISVTFHESERAQPGYTLFNIQDPLPPQQEDRVGALVVVNAHGEVVWWQRFEAGFVTDARVLPNGHLLYVYSPNGGPSQAFEGTWDGDVVWRSRDGVQVHHDVGVGPDGHYLYLTTIVRNVLGTPFEGDGIELVDPTTNDVLWSWDIFDHIPVTELNAIDLALPGVNGEGQDWTHSNAVVWDSARSLIWLSVRNLSRILAIDYPSGTVRATFGDEGLGGASFMDHQHAPEVLADGSLLYFDNGLERGWSRVAGFAWDEAASSITPTFEWRDDASFYDPALGDVDRLANGNVLVTSGVGGTVLQKPARLVEITPAGTKVWELDLGNGGRLLGYWIYRAERLAPDQLPDFARPFG